MRAVNIAQLKDSLSAYLDEVRRGEEIVIRDRQRAIAKIVPLLDASSLDEEEAELVAANLARPPERVLPCGFWASPAPRVRVAQAVAAVAAVREDA